MIELHPSGDVPMLVKARVERDGLLLLTLRESLRSWREAPLEIVAALDEVIDQPPAVIQRLLELPHTRQWLLSLREFIAHNRNASGVAGRMRTHARELDRLLFSCRAASGYEGAIDIVVQPTGTVHLPGLGVWREISGHDAGSILSIHWPADTWRDCCVSGVELWSSDMLVRKPGSRSYQFPIENETVVARWNQSLQRFEMNLDGWWSELRREARLLLQGIVQVECDEIDQHLSGTFGEVPGAIYLSWTDDEHVLHEAIVHELFHTRLNLMLEERPADSTARAGFWAPWRFELRPSVAFAHGVYAHLGMMLYNYRVARQIVSPAWRRKLATHLVRLRIAEAQWRKLGPELSANDPVEGVFGEVRRMLGVVWPAVAPELVDELLVACAGERFECCRGLSQGAWALAVREVVKEAVVMIQTELLA